MDRSEFAYELPDDLIAQFPLAERSASRLLVLDGRDGRHHDRRFGDLPDLLRPGDLIVCNDTRVLPARLTGRKDSGGRAELMLERVTGERTGLFQIRASKSPRPGTSLVLDGGATATVVGRDADLFEVALDRELTAYLHAHGEIPLPPYIERSVQAGDAERYQTVFARNAGAVAAPTAGLHFDERMFERLEARGVGRAFLTLHVGAGTFSPVRTDRIEAHRLHAERVRVPQEVCDRIVAVRASGGRVVAIGTTVVRALEASARDRPFSAFEGETSLFIYPGYEFRVVDGIVTNFHLPESSLLMLVCAFAGKSATLEAYRHAVEARYRFFSYGDAMLVWPAEARRCAST